MKRAEQPMAWAVVAKDKPTTALQWKKLQGAATLRPDEVVIRNEYIGLNPVDWKVIRNWPGFWKLGHVPGVDGAGTVVQVGEDVTGFTPGQRVAYHQDLRRNGSFASHTVIESKAVLRVPDTLPLSLAAALSCPLMTAWQAVEKIPRQSAAQVLVTGAGGMVGRFLVQLAAQRGYRVTAMASARHHSLLRELGAETVVDWGNLFANGSTDNHYFAVFDTVNAEHAASLAGQIEANGHLLCIQDRLETPPVPAFDKAISVHEVALNALFRLGTDRQWSQYRQAGEELLALVARETLSAPEPHIEPISALPEALEITTTLDRPLKTVIDVRHFAHKE